MRKDFGSKTWLYPLPVLIIGTYDKDGNPDAMNAAWGGIYDFNQITISLSSHRTTENMLETGAFTVSVATKKTVVASDYVGMVSLNRDPNKMKKAGLHDFKSKHVNAPLFEEYPFTLECKVASMEGNEKDGYTLIGDIINVSVDESVLTNGKVDVRKLAPIALDSANGKYIVLGEAVADAFKVGMKLK